MAKISPFKAIRPTRDKVHLVATRPYYTYKKNVLRAKLEDNPFTFLHIINPEFGSPFTTEPNSAERFQLVSNAYQDFIDRGILVQDSEAHLYLYRQIKDGHEYLGVVAGASVDEYNNDLIKKHEATLTSRENMFMEYLNIVGYNAEPVLLSYSDIHNEIEPLLAKKVNERPEYEYTTTDLIKHDMWLFNQEESEEIIRAFAKIDSSYIADGHHRSASSAGLKKWRENKGLAHYPNEDFFLAFFLEEKRLHILEFNRLVRSLGEMSPESFLDKLKLNFKVSELKEPGKPTNTHTITMCLRGKWYLLEFQKDKVDYSHPVKCLDAEILTDLVLSPILGISDLKTDNNIDFMSGKEPIKKIIKSIKKGKYDIAFFLFPITMDEVKRVADNNMIMPPKSTWVEPKLRSGLTIYNINE